MNSINKKEHILRDKSLYSIFAILVYMLGRNIPLYGVDTSAYQAETIDAQMVLIQAMSGDMRNCSLFILGLWPYMMAGMVGILVMAIFSGSKTHSLSPKGMQFITMFFTMIIGFIMAYGKISNFTYKDMGIPLTYVKVVVFVELIAGMMIVINLCDRAAKYGVAGRTAVMLVNIVDGVKSMIVGSSAKNLILPLTIGVIEIMVMLIMETTEKHIALQRVSINNEYAHKSYLAYKLNPVGVMSMMFASAVFLLPQFLFSEFATLYPDNATLQWISSNMRLTAKLGIWVYLLIIFLLNVFIAFIMLSPGQEAENLLKSGDSIVDVYAGKQTKRYLRGNVWAFSLISSVVLCICQGIPLFMQFDGSLTQTQAMLPCSIMMLTGMWISVYREIVVYRQTDSYKPFI